MFVCSKPLQVLNCASIVRSMGIADGRLHVTASSISDADGFRRFVESSPYTQLFSSITWNTDYDDAIADFTRSEHDTLFIEDDRVGRYRLFEPHRTERMVLFEEGIGTYRTSAERSLSGLSYLKWRILAVTTGCGWDFGSGRRTDLVMVSRPDVFRRLNPRVAHKAVGFPGPVDELEREQDTWDQAVLEALGRPGGGHTALVLATWGGTAPELLDRVASDADVVFHKAHPHDGVGAGREGVVEVGAPWIPAEAIVGTLARTSAHVTVYHHSSSVAFYLRGHHENVRDVDLLDAEQLRTVMAARDA